MTDPQPEPTTEAVCPWDAKTGGECGRRRREAKQANRECPVHDHQSLPAFAKGLRKH